MVRGSIQDKLQQLYGPSRNAEYEKIRGQMQKTHLPIAGAPPLPQQWDTSARADFAPVSH